MGLKKCEIYFDNPNSTYYSEQTVNGKVEINLDSSKKIRGIKIVFKGEAHTHWTESKSTTSNGKRTSRSVSYYANEEYFNIKYYLIGGSTGETTLPAGQHIYPFTCILPANLPSSFESNNGYIRYTIKVTLDRPWKFDQSFKAAFTVISNLDLNALPHTRESATLSMEKYFHFMCWKNGPLTGTLKVPCTGFVCGQVVPFTLDIDNASDNDVEDVLIKFKKIVKCHSRHPRSKTRQEKAKLIELKFGQPIKARSSTSYQKSITIPSIPPSILTNCSIIDLEYEISVEFIISGFHRNMHGYLPVTIGTIPLRNLVPMSQDNNIINVNTVQNHQPVLGWIPAPPTAPQIDYDLPPPTYEECQFGTKSIKDSSDSEYTRFSGNENYNPMYPVYKFNVPPRS